MTENKPEFVYVTYIQTTPERVYDALLDGEMTKTLLETGQPMPMTTRSWA